MKIDIKKKLSEAGMTRYELAKKINVTYPTIDKIYKGTSTSINFEILENMCIILNCTPNDILVMNTSKNTNELVKKILYKKGIEFGSENEKELDSLQTKLEKYINQTKSDSHE